MQQKQKGYKVLTWLFCCCKTTFLTLSHYFAKVKFVLTWLIQHKRPIPSNIHLPDGKWKPDGRLAAAAGEGFVPNV